MKAVYEAGRCPVDCQLKGGAAHRSSGSMRSRAGHPQSRCLSPSAAFQAIARKQRRGVIEKRRRDRINNCLSELHHLLQPTAFLQQQQQHGLQGVPGRGGALPEHDQPREWRRPGLRAPPAEPPHRPPARPRVAPALRRARRASPHERHALLIHLLLPVLLRALIVVVDAIVVVIHGATLALLGPHAAPPGAAVGVAGGPHGVAPPHRAPRPRAHVAAAAAAAAAARRSGAQTLRVLSQDAVGGREAGKFDPLQAKTGLHLHLVVLQPHGNAGPDSRGEWLGAVVRTPSPSALEVSRKWFK
ncbi:uncharacterized protein LOC144932775 isoform X1 [Lampetra fluviatilis]